MVELIMMVGLPGSGKSTLANELANSTLSVFSSDAYRKKLFGSENDQQNPSLVFSTLYADMIRDLKSGKSCIFDATNITMKDRKRCLDIVNSNVGNIRKVAVVVPTPIETCIERDKNRDRTVGVGVIQKMLLKFEFPQRFEGFDEICIYNAPRYSEDSARQKKVNLALQMSAFDQNNPHHKYDLLRHTLELSKQFLYENGSGNNVALFVASMYHDVGKMMTQTTDENGISHYYGHANYSTYWLLSNLDILTVDEYAVVQDILFYINYHMRIRDVNSKQSEEKYRRLFGNLKYDSLIRFMVADNIATGTEG